MTVANIIAYFICALLLYCVGAHIRNYLRDHDEKSVIYMFLCIVLAWIVAAVGGI